MSTASMTMDEVKPTGFHYRVAGFTAGGIFIDGYLIGLLTIALPVLPVGFGMTTFWTGMVGAAALIGLFIGSLVGGVLTDRFGRKKLYLIDLGAFLVLSGLQFFVTDAQQLFVIRVVLGIAIGIDYAVGPAYLTEFMPTTLRGPMVGSLATWWRLGFLGAVGVGTALIAVDVGDDAWKWILGSGMVPAAIVFLLRIGVPESPRWLVKQGHPEKAQEIVHKHLGPDVVVGEVHTDEPRVRGASPLRQLMSRRYRARTFFTGFFWACQVAPGAALTTFLPVVFISLGIQNENLSTVVTYVFNVVGGIAGLYLINRVGRRPLLIGTFWACAVCLLALAWLPLESAVAVILIVGAYSVFDAWGGNLQYLYPSELFPTELRATAAGGAAALSRIGSIVSTFLFPFVLASYGVTVVLLAAAAVTIAGAVVSMLLAPETRGLSLAEASGDSLRSPRRSRRGLTGSAAGPEGGPSAG